MSNRKILCVAEKPAIAKLVAQHLSGGSWQTVSFGCEGVGYLKNNLLTLLILRAYSGRLLGTNM
jgi:DNA topoisomerase IA